MAYLFDGDFTINELEKEEVQIEYKEEFNEYRFKFDRMKNICNNIRFSFIDIQHLILFFNESRIKQAKIISNVLKSVIRTSGKKIIKYVYYYDEEYKIWLCLKYCDFIYFFYYFFNNIITEIKKLPIGDEIQKKTIEKISNLILKKK